MAMFLNNMDTEELLNKLTNTQKDQIYRALWQEHVKEDVSSRIKDRSKTDDKLLKLDTDSLEELIENISYRYVYEGDYDCNLSYWTNIDSLIDEELPNILQSNELEQD